MIKLPRTENCLFMASFSHSWVNTYEIPEELNLLCNSHTHRSHTKLELYFIRKAFLLWLQRKEYLQGYSLLQYRSDIVFSIRLLHRRPVTEPFRLSNKPNRKRNLGSTKTQLRKQEKRHCDKRWESSQPKCLQNIKRMELPWEQRWHFVLIPIYATYIVRENTLQIAFEKKVQRILLTREIYGFSKTTANRQSFHFQRQPQSTTIPKRNF